MQTSIGQTLNMHDRLSRVFGGYDYPFVVFFVAQRAFIRDDSFFRAAALIAARVLVSLGADFPFHFAHRCFIALEIL
jgi:hypothetical protein